MYIELLKKTRLADNNRCGTLTLYTTGQTVEEIRALKRSGTKIVCFGCDNNSVFYIDALREKGLMPEIITDNELKTTKKYLYDLPVVSPSSLFQAADQYYFIVTLTDMKYINQVRIQLLLNGVRSFAILKTDVTFDFDSCQVPGLKAAFFESINEIYQDYDFAEDHFNQVRYIYLNPVKWWYNPLEFVVQHSDRKSRPLSLLDVGPGAGLESLIYQKLLGCELNWVNLPQITGTYSASKNSKVIHNHGVKVQIGYIEADEFTGTYDIIIFTDVIEHLAYNPVCTLKKLYGMLNPEGYLIVTTPSLVTTKNYEDWRLLPPVKSNAVDVLRITNSGHVYEYTFSELEDIFAESGFEIVYRQTAKKLQYVLTRK